MTRRRRLGLALVLVGSALLAYTGVEYARGVVARDAARAEWARIEARLAVLASESATGAGSALPAAPGAPVARLVIPSIGLDEVIVEGVGESELRAGPGHVAGTPLPGERGNAIISAHRDRHFFSLGKLQVGDTITTRTGYAATTWVVTSRRIVPQGARVLHQTPGPTLTLTTCWPIRYIGPAPDRLVFSATPIQRPTLALGYQSRSP